MITRIVHPTGGPVWLRQNFPRPAAWLVFPTVLAICVHAAAAQPAGQFTAGDSFHSSSQAADDESAEALPVTDLICLNLRISLAGLTDRTRSESRLATIVGAEIALKASVFDFAIRIEALTDGIASYPLFWAQVGFRPLLPIDHEAGLYFGPLVSVRFLAPFTECPAALDLGAQVVIGGRYQIAIYWSTYGYHSVHLDHDAELHPSAFSPAGLNCDIAGVTLSFGWLFA